MSPEAVEREVPFEVASDGKVDSIDFAIYLNQKAKNLRIPDINVTKIQKCLYICYGMYLAAYNAPLLNEKPVAGKNGPLFPRVLIKQKEYEGGSLDGVRPTVTMESLEAYSDIAQSVLGHFGRWSIAGLVAWTSERGNAWHKKFRTNKPLAIMDDNDIRSDFMRFVK